MSFSIQGGLESFLPLLEEFPSSCIADKVEAGPLLSIWGEGGVSGCANGTQCVTQLGGSVARWTK